MLTSDSEVAAILRSLDFNAEVIHLLGYAPDQFEEIYVVMLDGECVVSFEVNRNEGTIEDVESDTIQSYRRRVRGVRAKELMAALEEVQILRGRPQ